MIVITLSKAPKSLRGDLTKWCQEIQENVYVGHFSARVRDLLWKRINDNIGSGEATIVYNTNNELGYTFKTTRSDRSVIDFDGIPLMEYLNEAPTARKHGFSNAAHYHRARIFQNVNKKHKSFHRSVVSIDLETTGLHPEKDSILSIGAVKRDTDGNKTDFYKIINSKVDIPHSITELTGLTKVDISKNGIELKDALNQLKEFVNDSILVGYNLPFDYSFLRVAYLKIGQTPLKNLPKDLKPIVEEAEPFFNNYHLATVLKNYNINNLCPHNSLEDARATLLLCEKLVKNGNFKL